VGVLLSHGFTGGPASVLPLAKRLAEVGYQVEVPCLSGHGTRWQDMIGVTGEDWIEDLEGPLARLRDRCHALFVIGLSMGGTLALRLAQRHPDLRGVVLVNHALVFNSPLVPYACFLKGLLRSTPAIASDIKDPAVREPAYDRTPTAGVAELFRLAQDARAGLPELRQPLLIFKSREDHVLPLSNAPLTLAEVGSIDKEVVWLENSYHVATMDYDQGLIAERTLTFIQRLSREEA
jgi:carboxylesterase